MFEKDITNHAELFTGPAWEIGKIHWYIVKADTEMEKKQFFKVKDSSGLEQKELTEFGKEVNSDEIHWWVFKQEKKVGELLRRTENALRSVQKLKNDSHKLKTTYQAKSYSDLIRAIREFTDSHGAEIHELNNFVVWLHNKNVLAPSILFTYRVWGSTRISDRYVKIISANPEEDKKTIELCTEYALGLRTGPRCTIEDVHFDIFDEIASSTDPEYEGPISVPKGRLLTQTSHKILDELSTYFEFLRQSLRNIVLDIKKYNARSKLLFRESFWKSFIEEAMKVHRIENQLWDFKETLEIWIPTHQQREKANIKFCEQIDALANASGGVLIVGVTDKFPRSITGIQNLENKAKHAKQVLKRHINHDIDFLHFQQVLMRYEDGSQKNCLVIAVQQTKEVIAVRDDTGKYSYPVRSETGIDKSDYKTIRKRKNTVRHDNYYFISNFETVLDDWLRCGT